MIMNMTAIIENPTTVGASSFEINNQLELGLDAAKAAPARGVRRVFPKSQASWWFEQMRHMVDSARDWRPIEVQGESAHDADCCFGI
jgi:hypothetical protein